MPKPVKKPTKKKPAVKKAKRLSSDPNTRAHQLLATHIAKFEAAEKPWQPQDREKAPAINLKADTTVTPPHGDPFEAQFRARMSELGRKGGKVSGAKRMDMPAKKRREIALKAAKARWGKPR